MTHTVLHSVSGPRDVIVAQIRAVKIALRGPARVAAAPLVLATLLVIVDIVGDADVVEFHPEHWVLPGILGLLLPIAVWKGEERFGGGSLWMLPVDRRQHALTKVFAGWVWLVGAVALFVLWQLALTFLSGTTPLAAETRRVLPSFAYGLTFEPNAIQHVRWAPEPLLWLVPFTAATATYLLASALTLGARHPLRCTVGVALGVFAFAFVIADVADLGPTGPDRVLGALLYGPYGIDALLTARTESSQVEAALSTGERVVVWRALPNLVDWAMATLLWSGAGLLTLWMAASRHREDRRP
jgi:hypothetical protein